MSRGSFNNQALPYQIYNETLNTGKNLGGTKTKVRWRFGWSDEEGEHDIEFVHSKLSGKRVGPSYLFVHIHITIQNLHVHLNFVLIIDTA